MAEEQNTEKEIIAETKPKITEEYSEKLILLKSNGKCLLSKRVASFPEIEIHVKECEISKVVPNSSEKLISLSIAHHFKGSILHKENFFSTMPLLN